MDDSFILTAAIGTKLFAREPSVREFDLGTIVDITKDGAYVQIQWSINDSKTWIPRIDDCFQSLDSKRRRKQSAPFVPTEVPNSTRDKDKRRDRKSLPETTVEVVDKPVPVAAGRPRSEIVIEGFPLVASSVNNKRICIQATEELRKVATETSTLQKRQINSTVTSTQRERHKKITKVSKEISSEMALRTTSAVCFKYFSTFRESLQYIISTYADTQLKELLLRASTNSEENSSPLISVKNNILQSNLYCYDLPGYLLNCLRWLSNQYTNQINSILSIEEGLGDKLLIISFLSSILYPHPSSDVSNITTTSSDDIKIIPSYDSSSKSPVLILVDNSDSVILWKQAFLRWCPSLHVAVFDGQGSVKENVIHVLLLPYDGVEPTLLQRRLQLYSAWSVAILVEGWQQIQKVSTSSSSNSSTPTKPLSDIRQVFQILKASYKLLLVKNRLFQNNIQECWQLLHSLLPDMFDDFIRFQNFFTKQSTDNATPLPSASDILRHFILTLSRKDILLPKPMDTKIIPCHLTMMQRFWIRNLLLTHKNVLNSVKHASSTSGTSTPSMEMEIEIETEKKIRNLWLTIDKVTNSPYLLSGVAPLAVFNETPLKDFLRTSGKVQVLDKLLLLLKARGHRVVIFYKYGRLYKILAKLMDKRGHRYCHIYSHASLLNEVTIHRFNKPKSDISICCMSLQFKDLSSIELSSADTVLFLEAEEPEDTQAIERVHCAGQTKAVHVYRLVTSGLGEDFLPDVEVKTDESNSPSLPITPSLLISSAVPRSNSSKISKDSKTNTETRGEESVIDTNMDIEGQDPFYHFSNTSDIAIADPVDAEGIRNGNSHGTDASESSDSPIIPITIILSQLQRIWNNIVLSDGKESLAQAVSATQLVALMDASVSSSHRNDMTSTTDNHSIGPYNFELSSTSTTPEDVEVSTKGETDGLGWIASIWQQEVASRGVEEECWSDSGSLDHATSEDFTGDAEGSRASGAGSFLHSDVCQACHLKRASSTSNENSKEDTSPSLWHCSLCPVTLHKSCYIPSKGSGMVGGVWVCPQHVCSNCHSKAMLALFRCDYCTKAYCEDCLPDTRLVLLLGNSPRLEKLNYDVPMNVSYIFCSPTCSRQSVVMVNEEPTIDESTKMSEALPAGIDKSQSVSGAATVDALTAVSMPLEPNTVKQRRQPVVGTSSKRRSTEASSNAAVPSETAGGYIRIKKKHRADTIAEVSEPVATEPTVSQLEPVDDEISTQKGSEVLDYAEGAPNAAPKDTIVKEEISRETHMTDETAESTIGMALAGDQDTSEELSKDNYARPRSRGRPSAPSVAACSDSKGREEALAPDTFTVDEAASSPEQQKSNDGSTASIAPSDAVEETQSVAAVEMPVISNNVAGKKRKRSSGQPDTVASQPGPTLETGFDISASEPAEVQENEPTVTTAVDKESEVLPAVEPADTEVVLPVEKPVRTSRRDRARGLTDPVYSGSYEEQFLGTIVADTYSGASDDLGNGGEERRRTRSKVKRLKSAIGSVGSNPPPPPQEEPAEPTVPMQTEDPPPDGLSEGKVDKSNSTGLLNGVSVVPDMNKRLTRPSEGRFAKLGDIPQFYGRWLRAPTTIRRICYDAIAEVARVAESDIIGVVESDDIADFGGLSLHISIETAADALIALVTYFNSLKREEIVDLCTLIGICVATPLAAKTDANGQELLLQEPKFRLISGSFYRRAVSEVLAAFLLLPHSQNLVILSDRHPKRSSSTIIGSDNNPIVPDSVFCVARYLEALTDPVKVKTRTNLYFVASSTYFVLKHFDDLKSAISERSAPLESSELELWIGPTKELHKLFPNEPLPEQLSRVLRGEEEAYREPILNIFRLKTGKSLKGEVVGATHVATLLPVEPSDAAEVGDAEDEDDEQVAAASEPTDYEQGGVDDATCDYGDNFEEDFYSQQQMSTIPLSDKISNSHNLGGRLTARQQQQQSLKELYGSKQERQPVVAPGYSSVAVRNVAAPGGREQIRSAKSRGLLPKPVKDSDNVSNSGYGAPLDGVDEEDIDDMGSNYRRDNQTRAVPKPDMLRDMPMGRPVSTTDAHISGSSGRLPGQKILSSVRGRQGGTNFSQRSSISGASLSNERQQHNQYLLHQLQLQHQIHQRNQQIERRLKRKTQNWPSEDDYAEYSTRMSRDSNSNAASQQQQIFQRTRRNVPEGRSRPSGRPNMRQNRLGDVPGWLSDLVAATPPWNRGNGEEDSGPANSLSRQGPRRYHVEVSEVVLSIFYLTLVEGGIEITPTSILPWEAPSLASDIRPQQGEEQHLGSQQLESEPLSAGDDTANTEEDTSEFTGKVTEKVDSKKYDKEPSLLSDESDDSTDILPPVSEQQRHEIDVMDEEIEAKEEDLNDDVQEMYEQTSD